MRKPVLVGVIFLSALCFAQAAPKPNPTDGTVTAGVYRNNYFGFEYKLPAGFTDRTAAMPRLTGGSFGLLHLTEPKQPARYASSVTIFADDANDWKVKDGAQYLDKFGAQMQRTSDLVGKMTSFALGGHTFFRQDYSRRGVAARQTVVATVMKGYVLSAVLTAADAAGIDTLLAGWRAAKFAPPSKPRR